VEVDVAGWVCWKLGRSSGAGLRAAVCADALMPSEGAGGRGRRREEGRWCELDGGKERRVDARMREFVGKEALKEMEGCMPLGGGSDRDVLLVRVMLSSERDGGRICISSARTFVHTRQLSHSATFTLASWVFTAEAGKSASWTAHHHRGRCLTVSARSRLHSR
jgi:hypothetical protein